MTPSPSELARTDTEGPSPTARPSVSVLLVNGPPRVGKDTFARELTRALHDLSPELDVVTLKFATILKEETHRVYGVPAPAEAFEDVKDAPNPLFHGHTPRQAYIAYSEGRMKPLYGKSVFGRLLLEREGWALTGPHAVSIITDSGFPEEAVPIVEAVGAQRVGLIRLTRHGASFAGDSRRFLSSREAPFDRQGPGLYRSYDTTPGLQYISSVAQSVARHLLGKEVG